MTANIFAVRIYWNCNCQLIHPKSFHHGLESGKKTMYSTMKYCINPELGWSCWSAYRWIPYP